MSKKDYYQVLDLTPTCTPQDVRKNYHKLALVWHPDKHVNKSEAQHKFTEIHEAYSILADAKKRKIYDTSGHQGLIRDQELQDFTSCSGQNLFYQKGFSGSNKSAFDVLRGIFEENDEDDFFKDCSTFGFSDTFKTNIKSFINDSLISSENEDADSFFKNYKPTFMDSSFFTGPPLFQSNVPQTDCTTHTEFFSFFTSTDSEIHSYSRTSTTILHQGKVKTSTKQRVQKGGSVYQDEHNLEYLEAKLAQSSIFGNDIQIKCSQKPKKNCKKNLQDTQTILIDDETPCFRVSKQKSSPPNKKKQNKCTQGNGENISKAAKKACRALDLEEMADDENDLEECVGVKFSQRNHKKNKK